MRRRWRTLVAVAMALVIPTAGTIRAADPSDTRVAAAQRNLVERYGGGASDYELLVDQDINPDGVPLWAAKFSDRRTGSIRIVYVGPDNRAGGPEVLESAIAARDTGLSVAERKMAPDLRARAGTAAATEVLPVTVWMNVDTTATTNAFLAAHPEGKWIGDRPNAADIQTQRALRRGLEDARAAVYAKAAKDLEAVVSPDGGRIRYVSLLAPLVFIDAAPTTLNRLAQLDRVASMGLEGQAWQPSLDSAGPYVHADWHSGSLDQGTGTRVGVIEYYNVNPTGDMAGTVVASYNVTSTNHVPVYTPTGTFNHAKWVAGAIASQDSVHTGIAPGALIVSSASGVTGAGRTRDENVIRAADWAATTGDSDIINVSVNMDSSVGTAEARAYFDSIAGGESYRTVVVSAGNYDTGYHASGREWDVTSPGTSWNVLTVGGVNDGTSKLWYTNTTTTKEGALWEENPNAAYNPNHDFNKPNVSAPAVSVETASNLTQKGTSIATPIVSGIAAQVFARDPITFAGWPEPMRAIIMASAIRRVPLPGGSIIDDDHEGVGTVDAYKANQIYANGTVGGWAYGTLTSPSATVTKTFSVTAGQKVRVALSWDSHTSGSMFAKTDTLTADLDLTVTYPGGTKNSYKWDNNYEYVSFTAATAGTVTILVDSARFDGSSEYYGLAWIHW